MNSLLKGLDTSGKIRAFMAARDLTQNDLATLLDCTRETIMNRFDANRWRVEDLKKIAKAYNVNPKDLI